MRGKKTAEFKRCPHCGRKIKPGIGDYKYIEHMKKCSEEFQKKYHPLKEATHQCPRCELIFRNKVSLERHMTEHKKKYKKRDMEI